MFSDPLSPEDRAALEQFRRCYDAAGRPLTMCKWLPPAFEYGDDGEPLALARPAPTRAKPEQRRHVPTLRPVHLHGLALRYHVRHERWNDEPRTVHHGALHGSIDRGNVEIRLDHGRDGFAWQGDGSLRIVNTVVGLFVDVHVSNSYLRDRISSYAEAGELLGWSVGLKDVVERDGVITRATLDEISLCVRSRPATDGTYAKWLGV